MTGVKNLPKSFVLNLTLTLMFEFMCLTCVLTVKLYMYIDIMFHALQNDRYDTSVILLASDYCRIKVISLGKKMIVHNFFFVKIQNKSENQRCIVEYTIKLNILKLVIPTEI